MLRIGNAAGFWGDNLDAPVLLAAAGKLDYLTLEYLAELTMSILARLRQKDPQAGFASDFIPLVARLAPTLRDQPQLGVITNAGGMNPLACAAGSNAVGVQGIEERTRTRAVSIARTPGRDGARTARRV